MTDLNHIVLIGRVCKDVGSDERSFGFLPNGTAKAQVSIAVNRSKKQGDQWVDEVSYFDITIFGKTAENLKPYLTKGTQICVEGHLKQDRWEKDGQKQSRINIVADNVQLVGGKREGQSGGNANSQPTRTAPQNTGFTEGSSSDFPEDLPF